MSKLVKVISTEDLYELAIDKNNRFDEIYYEILLDDYIIERNEIYKKFEDELLLLTGSAGLWSGDKEYKPQLMTIEEFEEGRTHRCEDEKIEEYDDHLEIYCYHHDGTNLYILTPISKLKKSELLYLIKNELDYDIEEVNGYLKDHWKMSFNRATKKALIDLIETFEGESAYY